MIEHTFVHAPGIGYSTEQALWESGAHDWQRYLRQHRKGNWSGRRYDDLAATVQSSQDAIRRRDVTYFSQRLAPKDHWRLFPAFRDRVAYVDIETTGLSPAYDDVTVIALYDGSRCRTFVRDKNLEQFPAMISRYSLLVTFNGSQFDVPFLKGAFRGLRVPPAHVDLRFALSRLGYRGGLKAIERELGLERPSHLQEVDGFEAVRLWRRHQRGDRRALAMLLEYAEEDVKSLASLAEHACHGLAQACGMPHRLS